MSGGKKSLNIEMCDEVYYPKVTFVHTESIVSETREPDESETVILSDIVEKMDKPKQ